MREEKYEVAPEVIEYVFTNEIIPRVFGERSPVDDSELVMVFLGGQPGAGKSFLAVQLMNADKNKSAEGNGIDITELGSSDRNKLGNYAKIDLDDFREYHPRIKEIEKSGKISDATGQFAYQLKMMAIDYGLEHKYKMILDGTLRSREEVCKIIGRAQGHGYQAGIKVVAVYDLESAFGITRRYFDEMLEGNIPRDVDRKFHDDVYTQLLDTVAYIEKNEVYDSIEVRNRAKELVYLNDKDNIYLYGQPIEKPCAVEAIIQEREKGWSAEKSKEYFKKSNDILKSAILFDEKERDVTEDFAIDDYTIRDIKDNKHIESVVRDISRLLADVYDRVYNRDLDEKAL